MKNLIILFLIIPLLSFKVVDTNPLIGRWRGDDNGDVGYFTFYEDGVVSIEIDGNVFGGKEFSFKGEKATMTYRFNDGVTPFELDFIITILESGQERKSLGIVQIVDSETIRLVMNSENEAVRPSGYDDGKGILLHRVKRKNGK